jgi:actin-like ATPase involved in cell morphogenesis
MRIFEENLRVFGIDLGTTHSAIADVNEAGQPEVCRNINNEEITPSVVFFEDRDNVVVGSVAKNAAITYPDRVVSLIKRLMGTEATFEFDGITYTPESISALILKQLAQDAAAQTNSEVTRVVITVPAYFGMRERDATKNAGEIAGLDVIGIVPEPVAAALHYEAATEMENKTILVYDLGGATFDVTVIRVAKEEIFVVCTDGDTHLGGADWDSRLMEVLLAKFREQVLPGTDSEDDEELLQSVAIVAEDTKKKLSKVESMPVPLRGAGAVARVEVSRTEFETVTDDLLGRTIEIVRRTLVTLGENSPGATVDDVFLVGGSTKMPAVAQRLRAEFGWEPKLHDPELAVVKGAALYALGHLVHRELETARQQAGSTSDAQLRIDGAIDAVAAQTGVATDILEDLAAKDDRRVAKEAVRRAALEAADIRAETLYRDPVMFTASYPAELPLKSRHALYVHIHREALRDQLEAQLGELTHTLGRQPQRAEAPAHSIIRPESLLEIQPVISHVRCRPFRQEIIWREELEEARFEIEYAGPASTSGVCGCVQVCINGLLVAQVPVSLAISPHPMVESTSLTSSTRHMIRDVFGSYAHEDADVVHRCRAAYRALGIHLFVDEHDIDSGRPWKRYLEEQIRSADLFQLFWSTASAVSRNVKSEWRFALTIAEERPPGIWFLRPVYWIKPPPSPPKPLGHLHFRYLDPQELGIIHRSRSASDIQKRIAKTNTVS